MISVRTWSKPKKYSGGTSSPKIVSVISARFYQAVVAFFVLFSNFMLCKLFDGSLGDQAGTWDQYSAAAAQCLNSGCSSFIFDQRMRAETQRPSFLSVAHTQSVKYKRECTTTGRIFCTKYAVWGTYAVVTESCTNSVAPLSGLQQISFKFSDVTHKGAHSAVFLLLLLGNGMWCKYTAQLFSSSLSLSGVCRSSNTLFEGKIAEEEKRREEKRKVKRKRVDQKDRVAVSFPPLWSSELRQQTDVQPNRTATEETGEKLAAVGDPEGKTRRGKQLTVSFSLLCKWVPDRRFRLCGNFDCMTTELKSVLLKTEAYTWYPRSLLSTGGMVQVTN